MISKIAVININDNVEMYMCYMQYLQVVEFPGNCSYGITLAAGDARIWSRSENALSLEVLFAVILLQRPTYVCRIVCECLCNVDIDSI